jgi:hypothetical protein
MQQATTNGNKFPPVPGHGIVGFGKQSHRQKYQAARPDPQQRCRKFSLGNLIQ